MRKALFILAVAGIMATAWAGSPFDGTWKIDMSQASLPQASDVVLLLQNGTFECVSCTPKISVTADGTEQPVSPENKEYDTMSLKILDQKMVETVTKKEGKLVSTTKNTVSADGKTSIVDVLNNIGAGKQQAYKLTYARVAEGPAGSHEISGTWRRQSIAADLRMTIKSTPDGMMVSGPTTQSYDAKFDGKDYPVKGAAAGTTVSLKKVGDNGVDISTKLNGKISSIAHVVVAADGKTMAIKLENVEQNTSIALTAVKQ